jgi:hypothetical protein
MSELHPLPSMGSARCSSRLEPNSYQTAFADVPQLSRMQAPSFRIYARSVSVCRCQAASSSVTRRFRRRARIEMKAIATNAMRWSFERSKMVFNRR